MQCQHADRFSFHKVKKKEILRGKTTDMTCHGGGKLIQSLTSEFVWNLECQALQHYIIFQYPDIDDQEVGRQTPDILTAATDLLFVVGIFNLILFMACVQIGVC